MDTIIMYVVALVLFALSFARDRAKTKMAVKKGLKAIEGILPQFLAVIVIIALVLSVLDAKAISKVLGEESGFFGFFMAGLAGAVTLIPGFVAFPAAGELLKNGAGVLQIAAFVSSLMMVGVITLPMEMVTFGKKAAILRNVLAFVFSLLAAFFVAWIVSLGGAA